MKKNLVVSFVFKRWKRKWARNDTLGWHPVEKLTDRRENGYERARDQYMHSAISVINNEQRWIAKQVRGIAYEYRIEKKIFFRLLSLFSLKERKRV